MNLKHEVMGLLKNFFTRKKEKNDTKQTQENYLPISNILEDLKEKNIIIHANQQLKTSSDS